MLPLESCVNISKEPALLWGIQGYLLADIANSLRILNGLDKDSLIKLPASGLQQTQPKQTTKDDGIHLPIDELAKRLSMKRKEADDGE